MAFAAIYQIDTPFLAEELPALRFEQTGDGIVLTHQDHPPQLLQRYDHNDWRIADAPIGADAAVTSDVETVATANHTDQINGGYTEQDYQYAVSVIEEATERESQVVDGPVVQNDLGTRPGSPLGNFNTITWTAVAGAGRYRIYRKKNSSYGYIGTVDAPSVSFIDDNILPDFSDSPPRNIDPFADGEYPATVTFHNRRSFFGRTLTRPSVVFGSQTDDLFNYDRSRPLRATDSIEVSILGRRVNAIRHLLSLGDLIALTTDGVTALKSGSDGVMSPITIETRQQGYRGAGNARPELIDEVAFYTTNRGSAIRTLGYSFERDGLAGNDITVFARHFFSGFEIVQMAWCEQPSGVLWCLRSDGKLAALTWQAEQDVWGWSLCETDGEVESICAVSEEGRDVLYLVVRREIDGEERRYIERLTRPLWIDENWSDQTEAVVMDAAAIYNGVAKTDFTGLWWLEGREVAVYADGYVITGRTVQNGTLTPSLPNASSRVAIGLPYVSYARTLPVVVQGRGGSTKGRPQAAANAVVEVLNTRGIVMGPGLDPDLTRLYDAPIPVTSSTPQPMFSGMLDPLGLGADDWKSAKVTVAQLLPLPMVVLSISPDVEV